MFIVSTSNTEPKRSTRSISPIYSEEDYTTIRRLMRRLSYAEQLLITLRFWENCSIEEIARMTRISWEEAYSRLEKSYEKLREMFLADRENQEIQLKAA